MADMIVCYFCLKYIACKYGNWKEGNRIYVEGESIPKKEDGTGGIHNQSAVPLRVVESWVASGSAVKVEAPDDLTQLDQDQVSELVNEDHELAQFMGRINPKNAEPSEVGEETEEQERERLAKANSDGTPIGDSNLDGTVIPGDPTTGDAAPSAAKASKAKAPISKVK